MRAESAPHPSCSLPEMANNLPLQTKQQQNGRKKQPQLYSNFNESSGSSSSGGRIDEGDEVGVSRQLRRNGGGRCKSKSVHEYESLSSEGHQDRQCSSYALGMKHSSASSNHKDAVRMRQNQHHQKVGMVYYDYTAKENDELSLSRGSVMEIVKEECGEDGWVLARVDSGEQLGADTTTRIGMVPKNYVVLVGSQPEVVQPGEVQRSNKLLGSGGFADVFQGTYKGVEVALKVPKVRKDGETLKREALILSRLSHQNIVRFHGVSLDPPFIVMELCEGSTLFSLGRKMSSSDALTVIFWAKQVASAIDHLHSRNEPLVYADLKAENVLIKERPCECGLHDESWKNVTNYRRNGQCRKCGGTCINQLQLKLADFNVTRNLGVKRTSFAGSLPWMPPEVLESKHFQPSSDIWSFGMFLWELFSCKVPYKDCEVQIIFAALMGKDEKRPPIALPEDLPPELRNVFQRCWRRQQCDRPDIGEVLALLEQAEQSVDNNYKWQLRDEEQIYERRERHEAEQLLEDIRRERGEEGANSASTSIQVPLYTGLMMLERCGGETGEKLGSTGAARELVKGLWTLFARAQEPPTPAKRQKNNRKLGKESIGQPSNFRHQVSAQVRDCGTGRGGVVGPHDKTLVIRCNDDVPMPGVAESKQQMRRSHESLLDCREEQEENRDAAYCTLTLPSKFRHQQTRSGDEQRYPPPKGTPPPLPRKPLLPIAHHSMIGDCHECCKKLAAKTRELPWLAGKPKTAKSNPDLANCVHNHKAEQKLANNQHQQLARRHDYLSLHPRDCVGGSCQRPGNPIGIQFSEEECESGENCYVNVMGGEDGVGRALARANAIRPKLSESRPPVPSPSCDSSSSDVTTPTGAEAAGGSTDSSQLSTESNGFVVVGGDERHPSATEGDVPPGSNIPNSQQQRQSNERLSDLFNRRLSPPFSQPIAVSPSSTSAASLSGRRSTVGEGMPNSVFYTEQNDATSPMDSHQSHSVGNTPRRRSQRLLDKINPFTLFGGGSSPRNLAAADECAERQFEGVTEAHCFHPNHDIKCLFGHLCTLEWMKPAVALCRIPELEERLAHSLQRVPPNRLPLPGYPHKSTFVKRSEYPEKQRQRQRTESASISQNRTSTAGARRPTMATTRSPTEDPQQQRLSMHTVIGMQGTARNGAAAGSPAAESPCSVTLVPPHRPMASSISDLSLHTVLPFHPPPPPPKQQPHLLSPDRAQPAWHQRSRSSDSPGNGKLSTSELVELLKRPVPTDRPIMNPAYVPMQEKPKAHADKEEQKQKPLPHSNTPTVIKQATAENKNDLNSWPTSQAPMLNRAELEVPGEAPISEKQRPNSLHLAPPPVQSPSSPISSTPTTSRSLFTNSSASLGVGLTTLQGGNQSDSGMCASSGRGTESEKSTESENSPKNPAHYNKVLLQDCATVFSSSPNASPTVVSAAATEPVPRNVFSRRVTSSSTDIPHPPSSAPPPVPPKQYPHSADGTVQAHRMPPLPKNSAVMRHRERENLRM